MNNNINKLDILKNVKLLALSNFFIDFRLYSPIAIIYFSQKSNSYALGMSVFSIIMITQTLCEMPMGVISDYVGRKKTMILGSVFIILSLVFYILNFSYLYLVLGGICEGISNTFFSGNNTALLYESLKQVEKEKDFPSVSGKVNSMFQLALGISALAGSVIAIYFSLSILFWLTLIPYTLCLITSFYIIEPKIHSDKDKITNNALKHICNSFKDCFKNRKLRVLITSESIFQGVGEAVHNFRPAFIAMCWPTWAIGIHRTLAHIFGFIGFNYAGKIINKFSATKTLFFSSASITILNFIALFLSNFLSPILMALPSLSFGFSRTAMSSMQQEEFLDEQRATMGSISGMMGSLIFALMSIILGLFADYLGIIEALVIALVITFSYLYLNYRLYKSG